MVGAFIMPNPSFPRKDVFRRIGQCLLAIVQLSGGTRCGTIDNDGAGRGPRTEGEKQKHQEGGAMKEINRTTCCGVLLAAVFNGKPHGSFLLDAREVLKGGTLELWMGSEPNRQWGICSGVNSQKVAR